MWLDHTMNAVPSLRIDMTDTIGAVRDVLAAAEFTDQTVSSVFAGVAEGDKLGPWRMQALLRRTAEPTARNTLVRLLTFGVEVAESEAAAAVAPMALDDWIELGLVRRTGSGIAANCHIRAFHHDYLCSDFSAATAGPTDFVMGVSPSGKTLAGATLRHQVGSSLDLGTGSGFLALLLARHSDHVVATDINPRAINFARFNAVLNGLDIEVRSGSFFEPVGDDRFDLIVSNPPFVITPSASHMYMHGGLDGDGVSRYIADAAPQLLNEGGYCQFLASWMVTDESDWEAQLAAWFVDSGCDVWVLHQPIVSPEKHTLEWLPTEGDAATAVADVDHWLSYFASRGVAGIGTGLVTMRLDPGGSNVIAIDEAPKEATLQAGDATKSGFDLRVWLATASDAELLGGVYRIAADVRLEQTWQPVRGEGWGSSAMRLERTTGYRYRQDLDQIASELMRRCEAGPPLRAVVAQMAAETKSDAAAFEAEALPVVRRLLLGGFLQRVP